MIVDVAVLTDWWAVADNASFTRGGPPVSLLSESFLKKMIISEHSPLRSVVLRVTVWGIPYCNHVHFVRHHVGHQPYVSTQRTAIYDRRAARQDTPVNWRDELNAQALLDMMKKRLCAKADEVTRLVAMSIRQTMMDSDDRFLCILGQACRPACEWQGNICHEAFGSCGKYPVMEWWDDGC